MNGKGMEWAPYIALITVFIASTGYMTLSLASRINSVDQRIESLEARLDGRIDRMEDKMDARFDQIDE